MARNPKIKQIVLVVGFLFLFILSYKIFVWAKEDDLDFKNSKKRIFILDNGLFFEATVSADTIGGALDELKLGLKDKDRIIPSKNSSLYPGSVINIDRAIKIEIKVDGKTIETDSAEKTIAGAIHENNITLNRLDKVFPDTNFRPKADETIIITRINVEEKTITEGIDFKTIYKEDPKMGWQEQKVEEEGRLGKQETKYKISYKDGKEVSRIILEKNIISQPESAIITKGTYMKLGKADKGQGTWYAWKGGLFAASTSLPKGSYAKVTNLANGKTVIVQINDYGPQGKGRIIDLDKVAFAKIASLGAGVIGVKVEPILN